MEAHLNPRFNMWCRLIPDYVFMSETIRNRAKMEIVKNLGFDNMNDIEPIAEDYKMIKYDDPFANCVNKKKETDMYAQAIAIKHDQEVVPTDQRQIQYLLNRLNMTHWKKVEGLRKTYSMDDEPYPVTPQEYVERIKAGKFIIREADKVDEDEGPVYWDNPYRYIRFRDPERKADKEGYTKALKVLDKMRYDTNDLIVIKTPEEGLKALQEFEIADVTIE